MEYGCPTLAASLFLRLGWDARHSNSPLQITPAMNPLTRYHREAMANLLILFTNRPIHTLYS
jgi:hypothetical protein